MRHEQQQMADRLEALAAAEEAAATRVERAQSQALIQAQRAGAEMEHRLQSKLEATLAAQRRCARRHARSHMQTAVQLEPVAGSRHGTLTCSRAGPP